MRDGTYILINRRSFRVTRCEAGTGKKLWEIGKGKTLGEACDLATKELYEAGYPPEYGIVFRKEKA